MMLPTILRRDKERQLFIHQTALLTKLFLCKLCMNFFSVNIQLAQKYPLVHKEGYMRDWRMIRNGR